MTLICVPIMVFEAEPALRDAAEAKAAGADLVEFRLDGFFHGTGEPAEESLVVRLVSDSPLPCIITCRPTTEGGLYDGPEPARIALFERLGTAFGKREHPPRYLDVELGTYTRSANIRHKINLAVQHPEQLRDLSTSLILSMHDHQGRPADLTRRLIAMQQEPAAKVLKIAYRARSLRDNLELFDLLEGRDRPMIALGMGEFGLMSRVLAPKFGGFLTFASLRPEATTAPGQPTIGDLLNLYRFRSIGPATALYGVVGWPVAHSLSPVIHNGRFRDAGHDAVYLPLPVPAGYEHLKATLLELIGHPRLNLAGLSITAPHKQDVVRLAREQQWSIDAHSDAIGAANTVDIRRGPDGSAVSIRVFNTDSAAVLGCVQSQVPEVRQKRVGVIGAGGAARAAAYALANAGTHVLVHSRTPANVERLAGELNQHVPVPITPVSEAELADLAALVNCTPVGMEDGPAPEGLPVDEGVLRANPGMTVVETVYHPLETPLLRAARAVGLRTVDGMSMLERQAIAQSKIWLKGKAPRHP
jgi:3-dehydroquinate dehydratase / shikimate dehydrogenase